MSEKQFLLQFNVQFLSFRRKTFIINYHSLIIACKRFDGMISYFKLFSDSIQFNFQRLIYCISEPSDEHIQNNHLRFE